MIFSPEHSNVAQTAANLLEFVLATYEGLCERKSTSKSELDRHEKAIESAFMRSSEMIRDYLEWATRVQHARPQKLRINTMLRYCELGDSPVDAVHRYILVNRHKKQEAHRE